MKIYSSRYIPPLLFLPLQGLQAATGEGAGKNILTHLEDIPKHMIYDFLCLKGEHTEKDRDQP